MVQATPAEKNYASGDKLGGWATVLKSKEMYHRGTPSATAFPHLYWVFLLFPTFFFTAEGMVVSTRNNHRSLFWRVPHLLGQIEILHVSPTLLKTSFGLAKALRESFRYFILRVSLRTLSGFIKTFQYHTDSFKTPQDT